jgi:hypothetical protein
MLKISKDSAPDVQDFGLGVDRSGDLDDDYTVNFVTIRQGHSLAEMLKGLPGDRCPCPQWGYLFAGKITVSYADHEEVFEAGMRSTWRQVTSRRPRRAASSSSSARGAQLAEVRAVMMANAQRARQGA